MSSPGLRRASRFGGVVRVTVIDTDDRRHPAAIAENGEFVTIDRCSSCQAEHLAVRGTGITHHDHDTYYARAVAACCGACLRMETKVSTLFGIEENRAVLNGRPRVY
jgi:hypothetical protein